MNKLKGKVAVVTGGSRDIGWAWYSLYSSSKGAVSTFTRDMSKELGPKGVRVNAIDPGMIATKFYVDINGGLAFSWILNFSNSKINNWFDIFFVPATRNNKGFKKLKPLLYFI